MLQPSATVSFIVKCYFLKFFFFKKKIEKQYTLVLFIKLESHQQ